ncbi:MAG TPA: GerMN domain-containing protein [Candidatus Rubrimentiphilum sp.]|nr:GerMN domain-containing protein [Candidatus Rubrimentiphilum sp.]
MRSSRVLLLLALLIAVAAIAWYFTSHRTGAGGITVYYTKVDGGSEIPWTISVRPQNAKESSAEYTQYLALYAASQAVAGPPQNISAVRFPAGTHVLSATVDGTTATVDLSADANKSGGTLNESGEFKSLVWTLTSLPGIDRVAVRIAGSKVATLPGGSFEIDEPLRRSDW